jgi:hypothetical protein
MLIGCPILSVCVDQARHPLDAGKIDLVARSVRDHQ